VADVFDASFRVEDILGRFWGSTGGAVFPSDADESESNKSSTRAEAGVVSLPRAKVEDILFLEILTLMGEFFSAMPSPNNYATNFWLSFKGLGRASFYTGRTLGDAFICPKLSFTSEPTPYQQTCASAPWAQDGAGRAPRPIQKRD
jgi:hypothetical protein